MNATYLIPLLLCTLTNAAPRIEQISPATGRIDGNPVAYDLDNDGDLDIAYLNGGTLEQTSPASSTWLENLGNRRFSAPRTLGHNFRSPQKTSNGETLIPSPISDSPALLHHAFSSPELRHQIFSKSLTSSSWKLIHQFPNTLTPIFLETPRPDLPLVFTHALATDQVTLYFATPDSLTRIGQITLPSPSGNGGNTAHSFQAADLDQDGDPDLILQSQNRTLIYEQTSPLQFSDTPVILDLVSPTIGDLNRDGLPDLFTTGSNRSYALNQGNFTFTISSFSENFTHSDSTFLGTLGGTNTLFDFVPSNGNRLIKVSQSTDLLDFENDLTFENDSINTRALLVADFDQDGQSDVTFISRSTPSPNTIFSGGRSGGLTRIPGIPLSYYPVTVCDQVIVSWGQPSSLTPPVPASPVAPINCENPAIGDFNNDSFPDLVVGPDINGQARLLLNDGHGNFPNSRLLTELQPTEFDPASYNLQNFVPVDLNDDGHLDLSLTVVREVNSFSPLETQTACAIAFGDGTGSFSPVILPPGSFQTIANGFCGVLEFKDFDNDGDLDAILPGAWRENVNGSLRQSAYPLLQNAAATDALGNPFTILSQQIIDLDNDGAPDLFIPAFTRTESDPNAAPIVGDFFATFSPALAFNNGLGSLRNISEFEASLVVIDALGNPTILPHLALDLDLDGFAEILTSDSSTDALGNPTTLRIHCLKLDPDSPRDLSLAQSVPYPPFSLPLTAQLLDFNGDGELEYAANDQFITPTLRGPLISPKYNFHGDHLGTTYPALRAIAVADFDNDGDVDALYADGFSGLHLVRNTIVDEDSPITSLLISQGLTPAQSTPQADPDNDGRSNALELIQGSDPLISDQASHEFLNSKLSFNGSHLVFQQLTNTSDLAIYNDVEVSNDLVSWTRVPSPSPALLSTQGIWDQVSVAMTPSGPKKYYRISTTHDPRR